MAKLDIVNLDGQKVGDIDLDDSVFGVEVKEHLLWEVVKQQMASRRAGTHSTLRRDEVSGGGKKPFRQKGTGNARQGSSRAPNHVGGGKVFTPKPRDYSYNVPKKVRQAALRSALSLRVKENRLVVVNDLTLKDPKTKRAVSVLQALKAPNALIVDAATNVSFGRATRNLPKTKFLAAEGLNVYDILKYPSLILTPATVQGIVARLGQAASTGGAK